MPYFVLNSEGLLSAHRTSDSTKSSSLHFPKCSEFRAQNACESCCRRSTCLKTLWVLKKKWCSSSWQNSIGRKPLNFVNVQNSNHSKTTWPPRESRQPKSPDEEAYSRLSQCAQHLDRFIGFILCAFRYCIHTVLACSITSLSLWSQVMRTKTSSLRQTGIKPRLAAFIQSEEKKNGALRLKPLLVEMRLVSTVGIHPFLGNLRQANHQIGFIVRCMISKQIWLMICGSASLTMFSAYAHLKLLKPKVIPWALWGHGHWNDWQYRRQDLSLRSTRSLRFANHLHSSHQMSDCSFKHQGKNQQSFQLSFTCILYHLIHQN